jgi:hypothetical protein
MHLVKNDMSTDAEKDLIRKARRAVLNKSVLKLGLLNLAVYSTIYGASTHGEPGSTIELLFVPLAFVSTISLANSIARRLALIFQSREHNN